MRIVNSFLGLAPMAILTLALGCSSGGPDEIDPNRGPLGKADGFGSCENACGGQAPGGSCWCDDACSFYGDCCADKVDECDAPQAQSCGGHTINGPQECSSGQYCHYELGDICGFADAPGVCMDIPETCIEIYHPVCGCDGLTYSNSCFANAAGTSVQSDGECAPQTTFCGGFANFPCPDGLECVDDPNDDCDPMNGGADCGGMCVTPEVCPPVLCTLACEEFQKDADGCDICACVEPAGDSCDGQCGGASEDGTCYCDDLCTGYGDCCDDFADECEGDDRVPASGLCVKNSNDQCQTDDDCMAGGCGGELCYNPDVSSGISTCNCVTPSNVTGCGCVSGSCTWWN